MSPQLPDHPAEAPVWTRRIVGWDEHDRGPVPVTLELGPNQLLLLLRLGDATGGTVGFEVGQARRATSAIQRRAPVVVTVLHPEAVVASLLVEPATNGVILTLVGEGTARRRVRFHGRSADRLASLLAAGVGLLAMPVSSPSVSDC
ncbi:MULTISPECIES: hypothetical protein [Actinoalloteichus]|uniref:Uncharacterized protein n=1 Tax=Actinoalloteichus caeruleus DSM 43889 TaxID=1120930 RepID=A0ABT1JLG1_ACTCY|nr:hypothetical protein [Actinoalloteichus caeruleus]MCP2333350.1 hypothetical protein [Actinoalloteichus caeruleus DSM 43889]